MKRFAIAILALTLVSSAFGQEKQLKFNDSGEFRIVQFTDLHYNSRKMESNIVLKRIDEVLDAEKADLVVITGDFVYSTPSKKAMKDVLECISGHDVPFCLVFGNHDADFGTDKAEMYDYARRFPGCLMPEQGLEYVPDYALPVLSADGEKTAEILYFIDSNAHLFEKKKFVGYDCIHDSQVDWYRRVSRQFTASNGGVPLPAVAFFHIPLPEFHDAVKDEGSTLIGTRMEPACAPERNSGMFTACKKMGDVMAVFVGHDHDNDYAVNWQDILLAYGRYTGGNTEYNNLPNGARVIVLKEGKRELESYIRVKGGQILNRFSFPADFHQSEWRDRPLDPECN